MPKSLEIASPWPGPRPYMEHEWPIFFGRNEKIEEIEESVLQETLLVLTGASGVGKTSLLRAGVVPRLRLGRYRDGREEVWPVLVMREWGKRSGRTLASLVEDQLEEALEEVALWGDEWPKAKEDYIALSERLKCADRSADPLDMFCSLVVPGGEPPGLILIFDQVEEVLRQKGAIARETTRLLRDLVTSGLNVKILLSLREEHLSNLRDLERAVGGLMNQSIFLEPMELRTIRQAFEAAAGRWKVTFGDNIVSDLVNKVGAAAEDSSQLLALQAVFLDFFRYCIKSASGMHVVRREDFARYCSRYGIDFDSHGSDLAKRALEQWIEKSIQGNFAEDMGAVATSEPQSNVGASAISAEGIDFFLIRRIAIRLAPHLSSGGFKIAQEDLDLLQKAIGEELCALAEVSSDHLKMISIIREKSGKVYIRGLNFSGDSKEGARILSGLALEKAWSPARAAEQLTAAYFETLRRLGGGNILRPIRDDDRGGMGWGWELVHDGVGLLFAEWARGRRNDWADCASALAACRGITPIAIKEGDLEEICRRRVHHLRWEGCLITPREGKVSLVEALFEDCYLKGSVFEGVVFLGCRFRGGELNGTIFKKCVFVDVLFENCHPESLAILGSEIRGLEFTGCVLSQLTMRDNYVAGRVIFRGCNVSLSNFVGLTGPDEGGCVIFGSSSSLSYSAGDDQSWKLMQFESPPVSCKVS